MVHWRPACALSGRADTLSLACWSGVCVATSYVGVPTVIAMITALLLTSAQNSAGSAVQLLQPDVLDNCAAVQPFVAAHAHAEQPADALCCKEQLQMQQG